MWCQKQTKTNLDLFIWLTLLSLTGWAWRQRKRRTFLTGTLRWVQDTSHTPLQVCRFFWCLEILQNTWIYMNLFKVWEVLCCPDSFNVSLFCSLLSQDIILAVYGTITPDLMWWRTETMCVPCLLSVTWTWYSKSTAGERCGERSVTGLISPEGPSL